MGNKNSKPKVTENAAVGSAQGSTTALSGSGPAMPSTPHLELHSEIENICDLYDTFVRSKSTRAGIQATCLQLDLEALFMHKGQLNHETISRLVVPSSTISAPKLEPREENAAVVARSFKAPLGC